MPACLLQHVLARQMKGGASPPPCLLQRLPSTGAASQASTAIKTEQQQLLVLHVQQLKSALRQAAAPVALSATNACYPRTPPAPQEAQRSHV
jgi:hypothetical protein